MATMIHFIVVKVVIKLHLNCPKNLAIQGIKVNFLIKGLSVEAKKAI